MIYFLLPKALEVLKELPPHIQKKFWKQLGFLLKNLRYPSLRVKKYDETEDIWQARIDNHYRFYFKIESDQYVITNVKAHSD